MSGDTVTSGNEYLSGDKDPTTWVSHPVDIRVSLPFFATRFYVTVVAGREKRRPARLHEDRQSYPLATFGNLLFAMGVTTILTIVALGALIAQSAIIQ